jgi:hypothetical protein
MPSPPPWHSAKAKMPANMLQINRNCVQGIPNVPADVVAALVKNGTAAPAVETAMQALHSSPGIVPCSVLHPTVSCPSYWRRLFLHVLGIIAPVYGTLNVVPRLILKPQAALKSWVPWFRGFHVALTSCC